MAFIYFFFFQAEDGIRDLIVTGVQTCALPIFTDVLRLADGSRFSPALIENKLKFSPHVREAVVIGEDRPHVVALIQIDMGNVGSWAKANRLPFTTFKDLSHKAEVSALIEEAVARVNQELPAAARIRVFG